MCYSAAAGFILLFFSLWASACMATARTDKTPAENTKNDVRNKHMVFAGVLSILTTYRLAQFKALWQYRHLGEPEGTSHARDLSSDASCWRARKIHGTPNHIQLDCKMSVHDIWGITVAVALTYCACLLVNVCLEMKLLMSTKRIKETWAKWGCDECS